MRKQQHRKRIPQVSR
ncbi:hypothetical protein D049_0911A, partial [Vibrio parahaemolyticus VPTS-2010]